MIIGIGSSPCRHAPRVLKLILLLGSLVFLMDCGRRPQSHAPASVHRTIHRDAPTGRYYYIVHLTNNAHADEWHYYWLTNGSTSQKLERDSPTQGKWIEGDPPKVYASRSPTDSELSSAAEAVVDVVQSATEEHLDIPEPNSLDSMEGVPEAGASSEAGASEGGSSDAGFGGGDSGGSDGGGGDGGGG